MSWGFLVWMAAFVLQAGLLGRTMYALILLSDLETDMINPFELAPKLNNWVLILAAYLAKIWLDRKQFIETTDVFKQLPQHKFRRFVLLGGYLVCFVLVIYRLVEFAIHSVMTPAGRLVAQKMFKDGAATILPY